MGKKCKKTNLMVMLLGAGVVLSMTGCSDSKSQAIIEKLDIATDMTHDTDAGNRYLFDYDDQWEINYNKDAQTVRFVESAVEDCICSFAGIDYIGDNVDIVIYDWNDNAYHTNVDYIDEDGDHVSTTIACTLIDHPIYQTISHAPLPYNHRRIARGPADAAFVPAHEQAIPAHQPPIRDQTEQRELLG